MEVRRSRNHCPTESNSRGRWHSGERSEQEMEICDWEAKLHEKWGNHLRKMFRGEKYRAEWGSQRGVEEKAQQCHDTNYQEKSTTRWRIQQLLRNQTIRQNKAWIILTQSKGRGGSKTFNKEESRYSRLGGSRNVLCVVAIWIIMRNFQRKRAVKGPSEENGKSMLGGPELPCHKGEVEWSESRSVVSHSLRPRGLHSPWNSPGQNTGVGSLSLLQVIFPTQGSDPGLPHWKEVLYGVGSLSLLQGIFPTQGSDPGLPHWKQALYRLSRKGRNSLDGRQLSIYRVSLFLCWVFWPSDESTCPISETYFQGIKLYSITKETTT